jgi:hypothetical protein
MTTTQHLRNLFSAGYDSGDVLKRLPDRRRRHEERLIGGSYRRFFMRAVRPELRDSSMVVELGPGSGSWTRALLRFLPRGQVQAVDFVDTSDWLSEDDYDGRLVCHQVQDNSFDFLPDETFDFFFSFGVLCHNTTGAIGEVLGNALAKMRPGGTAVHQYGDWQKLERLGWEDDRHGVPAAYRDLPDDHEWQLWPRNDPATMAAISREAGWIVEEPDLDLFRRDSVIRLRAPGQ